MNIVESKENLRKNGNQPRKAEYVPHVVLATGGTAGHVFPAEALIRALQNHPQKFKICMITDKRGNERMVTIFQSLPIFQIYAAGIIGRKPWQILGAGVKLLAGLLQAWRLLHRLRPDIVVGFGGYSSLPTMFAANLLDFPTMIHEQNARLGRTNRLLAPGMNYIATAFEVTDGIPETSKGKIMWSGNPVRSEIMVKAQEPYIKPGKTGKIRIFIVGGSQGARVFGDKIPTILANLPDDIKKRLHIVQQVRFEQLETVKEFYQKQNITADIASFFTDISTEMVQAQLIICRSGAATLAEITTIGRPAIFVPYPFATDDHQMINATRITEAGGGWTIPQSHLNIATLSDLIMNLLSNPYRLEMAAACAGRFGNPQAAENMVMLILDSLQEKLAKEA